jgi:hypothetical protein
MKIVWKAVSKETLPPGINPFAVNKYYYYYYYYYYKYPCIPGCDIVLACSKAPKNCSFHLFLGFPSG